MERKVMEAIYHAFQHWMLCACLAGLGMIAALVFLAKVAAPAWDALRRWWSLPCIQRVIVGVCVVGLSYYGATKQGWHVGYDGGIKAGATANVVTNDTVSIHWQRDTSGGVYVPETATVYIDAIEHGSSNVVNIAQTTVGAWGWSGTVENATNYDYTAWAYYIPPEPVHTNGVWTYKTHFDRNGEYVLPLRARVEVNGVAIATPKEKRKDEATYSRASLLAMWDGIDHGNDPLIWRDLSGNGYDATQRVANAGWSWGNNAYIGTANNGHGFRTPIAIVNALREHIDGHTIEIVYLPSNTSRQTIFGQYKVAEHRNGGLNIEYSPHQPGWFRVYYSSSPDFNTPAWKKTQSRLTCAVVCDENNLRLYENGVHTSTAAKPNVDTIGYSKPFIIGGENERTNMSIVGELFCVRVYSRALTEEELKRHVKIDNERFD